MIIDKILDRRDGEKTGLKYNPYKFYKELSGYYQSMPEVAGSILDAMDEGTEEDIRQALTAYIYSQGYNRDIAEYINSRNWL